jgi:plastocyanin
MIHLALTMVLAAGPATPERPCVMHGKLTLQLSGGTTDPDVSGKTVVYVKKVPHSLWREQPTTHHMEQKNIQFSPQVMVVIAGDTVEFKNLDKEKHSVFSKSDLDHFEFGESTKGVTGSTPLQFPESVLVQCDIHGKMRADIKVLANPFYATPAADGAWRIDPLPAGDYEVRAWERNGAEVSAPVHCAGDTNVQLPLLKQAPEPVRRHKDGRIYTDHSPY